MAKRTYQSHKLPTVAVDLDATLLTYDKWKGLDHFGEVRPGAKDFLNGLKEIALVLIYTTRCNAGVDDRPEGITPQDLVNRVAAVLDANELYYDDIWSGQGKPLFAAILDDRAVAIPPNPVKVDYGDALIKLIQLLARH
jgi:hypothetical protein